MYYVDDGHKGDYCEKLCKANAIAMYLQQPLNLGSRYTWRVVTCGELEYIWIGKVEARKEIENSRIFFYAKLRGQGCDHNLDCHKMGIT